MPKVSYFRMISAHLSVCKPKSRSRFFDPEFYLHIFQTSRCRGGTTLDCVKAEPSSFKPTY